MHANNNHLTDPRFLVITAIFVLYGVFVILVLFFAGTPFWNGLWQLCKDFVGCGSRASAENDITDGRGGEEGGAAHHDGNEGTSYQLLSERSKRRLDTLRQLAIERLLVNYSMKLRQENLVVVQQQNMTLLVRSNSETIINNGNAMISNEGDSTTTSSNTVFTGSDIEEGFCSRNNDNSENNQGNDAKDGVIECDDLCRKGENVEDNFDNDYTHVILPHAGVGLLDGLCIETSQDELTSDESNSSDGNDDSSDESVVKRKWPCKQHIPRREEDEARNNHNNNKSSATEIVAIQPENNKTTSRHTQQWRQVPIFCSICLSEFDLHQQICWSSNPECTHVFHSDCMIQWLVALGRKRSTTKRFTLNPTERQLVEHYELQCPCCRQEFIKSAFIEEKLCDGGQSNSSDAV